MTLYQRVRVWYYRVTGQRRRAGGVLAAVKRKSRFVERSRSQSQSPSVVICDEVAK